MKNRLNLLILLSEDLIYIPKMFTFQDKFNVLVVGAHGHLGRTVIKHLFKAQNVIVSALDKNMDEDKKCCFEIIENGGRIISADLNNPSSLRNCCKGIHTVVSCIEGDEKSIFNGQMALLQEAIKSGVKRFVPAGFTVNFENATLSPDETLLCYRKRFIDELNKTDIKGLYIHVGMFIETYFSICHDGLCYWGDKNQKLDLISCYDAAHFIAACVADPDRTGHVYVTGNEVAISDLPEIFKKATGKELELKYCGTIEDLRKEALQAKEQGNWKEAERLMYAVHAFDGQGQLYERQNEEFNIFPMTLEEYIKGNPKRKRLLGHLGAT